MESRRALATWPVDQPVAVVAWGNRRSYWPSPVVVCGEPMRSPADMAVLVLRQRLPLVLQWHNLNRSLPRDPGARRSRAGLTGLDAEVQQSVFCQVGCPGLCEAILRRPCNMVMPEPLSARVVLLLYVCCV